MTKPKGLCAILALFLSLGTAFAQKIQVAGVKKARDCEFATRPLVADLRAVGFPKDWTIVVACNENVWRYLQLRGNAIRTNTAYTNVKNRITVINATMYRGNLPLTGSTHVTPRVVLMHEHGHVLCNCNDEEIADNIGLRAGERSNARLDARSFADLLRKAQRGDHWAQNRVGVAFSEGEVVRLDAAEAVRWFTKAAAGGEVHAQHNLGVMLYRGTGVNRNLAEALAWFEKAAAKGLPEAEFNAGCLYERGLGVPQNFGRALALLQESASHGLATAQNNLGQMYEKGEGVAKDPVAAVRWFQKSAEQGNPIGEFDFGAMLWNGAGVAEDVAKAVYWFRLAAQQGNAGAQLMLGLAYRDGIGVSQDYQAAAMWLVKSAEQGTANAQVNLAALYKAGLGVPLDLVQAYRWYRLSERGSTDQNAQLRELVDKMSRDQIADAERTETQRRPEHDSSQAESTISGLDLLE